MTIKRTPLETLPLRAGLTAVYLPKTMPLVSRRRVMAQLGVTNAVATDEPPAALDEAQ